MSDADPSRETTFDPTESVRTLSSDLFTEERMTLREHQDTDRHYIGDALPIPSPEDTSSTTFYNSVGDSPFPARANHSHAFKGIYCSVASSGMKVFPPGKSYWNNLIFTGYGHDMVYNPQILVLPMEGMWRFTANFLCARTGGGKFENELEVFFSYNNGGYEKKVFRGSTFDIPSSLIISVFDEIVLTGAKNVQFAIGHNDSAVWECYNQGIVASYICPLESN